MTHMKMYFLDLPRTTQDADASHQQDDEAFFRSGDPQPNYDYNPSFKAPWTWARGGLVSMTFPFGNSSVIFHLPAIFLYTYPKKTEHDNNFNNKKPSTIHALNEVVFPR